MLTQDQEQALQEIANIGMGQAGASIAEALGEFVQLSVPRILFVPSQDVPATLARSLGEKSVSAVRQAFHNSIRGEAIVIFGEQRCADLADLMGYEHGLDRAAERELLLDVSNMLVGACLSGIGEQLRMTVGFTAPSLMGDAIPLDALFATQDVAWNTALLVEINFSLERRSFACDLLILMPESEVASLARQLDHFLEELG